MRTVSGVILLVALFGLAGATGCGKKEPTPDVSPEAVKDFKPKSEGATKLLPVPK